MYGSPRNHQCAFFKVEVGPLQREDLTHPQPQAHGNRHHRAIGLFQQVANLLDNLEPWLREAAPNEPLSVYIGAENPIGRTAGVSLIISRFRSPFSDHSYIGTLGPTRQSYRDVMTLVRHAGETLEEVLYA